MNDDLETQVSMLQSHLDGMISRVQKNEKTLQRFQDLEMQLLSLNSLRELVEHVLEDVQLTFDLEAISFVVADADGEIKKFLVEDGFSFDEYVDAILLSDLAVFKKSFGRSQSIILGDVGKVLPPEFWPQDSNKPTTVSLIPLMRRGMFLGALVLGSDDSERFKADMATSFLDRLGKVLSVCMENTLNYEQLRRSSLYDTLTGVNNRRFFEQRLDEEILRSLRTGDYLSCIFLDIDFFKKVNDTYGHQVGDIALKHVADLIKSQLRSNDILARYGGEEFVAILSTANIDKALEVAERMRACVEVTPFLTPEDAEITITVSAGVATFVVDAPGSCKAIGKNELIDLADKALYAAKGAGRNQVISGGEIMAKKTLANRPK